MFNKVIIAGNLTRDIEIRYTQSGSAIGSTGIATTRKFKSQSGEQKEEACFVDITFFGHSAEIANQYLRKGSKCLVEGRLKLDQWVAQDGTKRSKHGITVESMQMLDSKPREEQSQYAEQSPVYNHPGQPGYGERQATPQNNQDSPLRHNVAGGMNKPPQGAQTVPPVHNPVPEMEMQEGDVPF